MSGWKRLAVVLTAVWVLGTLLFFAVVDAFAFGLIVGLIPPMVIWGLAWALAGFRR